MKLPACHNLIRLKMILSGLVFLLFLTSLYAQTGSSPSGKLLCSNDGFLYGENAKGGQFGNGTIFRVDTAGNLTVIYAFSGGADGSAPSGGLVEDGSGNLYGTTKYGGGSSAAGTAFKLTKSGSLNILVTFSSNNYSNGWNPNGVILARDGNLYGTTSSGGGQYPNSGTVFQLTTNGTLTTLASLPEPHGLIEGDDGNLYGTTFSGSTVFSITKSGSVSTVFTFTPGNGYGTGYEPIAGVIEGNDGNLYGTTSLGGPGGSGNNGAGTVYKVTKTGTFTLLVSFYGQNGMDPSSGLLQANNGVLYGVTPSIGPESINGSGDNPGSIFSLNPDGGSFATLVQFVGSNGAGPGTLVQSGDGNIYGVSSYGGTYYASGTDIGGGTVFKLTGGGSLTTLFSFSSSPALTTQPSSQSVIVGASATFSTAVTGTAAISYQWQKNGANILGATGSSYAIPSVLPGDAANYSVVLSNQAGTTVSSTAQLTVAPFAITNQPASQSVTETYPASFSVTVSGSGPFSYQWKKDGMSIQGATNASYSIVSTAFTDAGNYSVTVANSYGNITSASASLTVNPGVPPSITTGPVQQEVYVGDTVVFSVSATGADPLSYQWSKDGTNISGATGTTLTLPNVQPSAAGDYSVYVSNRFGNDSSDANLTVDPVFAPSITGQPSNASVTMPFDFGPVNFSVTASGSPPPTYQWQISTNGGSTWSNLSDNSYYSGSTTASLTLDREGNTSFGSSQNGEQFQCIVNNRVGSVTSNVATLSVAQGLSVPTTLQLRCSSGHQSALH